jgi:hypothetical protein
MTWDEYKQTINMIESCKPVDEWPFDRMITLLGDVVLKLDQVDDAVDRISEALDK